MRGCVCTLERKRERAIETEWENEKKRWAAMCEKKIKEKKIQFKPYTD